MGAPSLTVLASRGGAELNVLGEFRDRGLDAETGLKESVEAVPLNRVCSAEEVAHMLL
ncbi:MAG: hypothetical protein OEQ39_22780 [Gammaproteobacteria bacterium]|nr:hypothetical protein [Gammaproteobacteria bacterium]